MVPPAAPVKKKNKRKRFVFQVFDGFEIFIIVTTDIEKTAKRLGEDLSGAEAGWLTKDDRPGTGWLVFPYGVSEGLVSHECSHAIRDVFRHHGVEGDDDETFAYHQGYLVKVVHDFMKGINGRKKRK